MRQFKQFMRFFALSMRYPSNLWRWPVVILIRLPAFVIIQLGEWLQQHDDSIPAIKWEETHHDQ